jgi:ribose 5-phosphate isomerase B
MMMRVAVGADHAGFPLKDTVIEQLESLGHEVIDCGTHNTEAVDYPDFAQAVAEKVSSGETERGIVLCGSGVGATVAANKVPGVRACLCHDTYSAHQGVEHDDLNVLCLGARIIGPALASEIVRAFISAKFSGEERHRRRLHKVLEIEKKYSQTV